MVKFELDHITAIVENLQVACDSLTSLLGSREVSGIRIASMDIRTFRTGSVELHVNAPTGSGPVADHLRMHGPGIHHVAFRCRDLDAALRALAAFGLQAVGEPVESAPGLREVFLKSENFGGIRIQLVERTSGDVAKNLDEDAMWALTSDSSGESP